jgi:hypothetical protein
MLTILIMKSLLIIFLRRFALKAIKFMSEDKPTSPDGLNKCYYLKIIQIWEYF